MSGVVEALLPPGIGMLVALAMLAASFVASFITIAFGIGGGLFLLAIMASLLPPAMLVPVHGIVQAGSNLGRMGVMFRFISWPNIGVFTIGTLIGVTIGAVVVINLSPAIVLIVIGCFVIWSIFAKPPLWLRRFPAITGMVSSFLTMFFGATGVFVAIFTKSLGLDRHGFVATHATLMSIQHVAKTLAFGLAGVALGPWLWLCAAMIGAGILGTMSGRLVLNLISDRRFRWALDAILLVLSLRLIWQGASALIG